MADDKKTYYLDLTGLQQYDVLIKSYINGKDAAIKGNLVEGDYETIKALSDKIKSLEGTDHTHSNFALLETYTQTEADLADAVSKKHSHANADVLDGINDAKVAAWDQAVTDDHTHANKTVLDGIDADKVAAWDAAQTNVIEAISVNGNAATIENKTATVTIPEATTSKSGVMSAADKTKLDGIATGAEVNYIKSVGDNLAVDNTGKLTVTIPEATVTGVDGSTVNGLKLTLTDKVVGLADDGLAATLTSKNVTVRKKADTTDDQCVYEILQGETVVGTINHPKDMVVTGGEVIVATDEEGLTVGEKYLKLTIANQDTPVYIAVTDLVDVYTAGAGIAISETNSVSVKLADNASKDAVSLSVGENGLSATLTGWDDVKAKVNALDTTYSPLGHTHTKSEITDFAHTHVIADITDFGTISDADILALFPGQSE